MFMVAIFSGLIAGKRRTIADVPEHLKEPVLADLAALGLDSNGDPIVVA
ncbi:MAG: CD1375 family protein [Paenisporosarcina sp.]